MGNLICIFSWSLNVNELSSSKYFLGTSTVSPDMNTGKDNKCEYTAQNTILYAEACKPRMFKL